MSGRLRIGSLFSGAGGLDLAVEDVLGGSTAWHCETDKAASKVLAARWPGVPNHGDVTAVDWAAVEPVDVLCGGWPCQPFSLAGKRRGAEDERALWPEVARAVGALRPGLVVLENVAAVAAGGELSRATSSLASLGYVGRWACVRASDVGAPHRRERCFVVAWPAADTVDHGHAAASTSGPSSRFDAVARRGDAVPTNAASDGRDERWPESAGIIGGPNVAQRGADFAAYAHSERLGSLGRIDTIGRDPDGCRSANGAGIGGKPASTAAAAGAGADVRWGVYEPAIRRWERLTRPAPAPTETGPKGGQRLSPVFTEWLMGWPAGWVTDVPGVSRNEALRICGNGVVPQQAAAALSMLLESAQVPA